MADAAALAVIRSYIGAKTPPSDNDLTASLDRLKTAEAVALEILRGRLADMLASPASVSLSGDWSQDASANIRALKDQVADLQDKVTATSEEGLDQVIGVARLVRLDHWRR
jgi:hypothetical protein